MVLGHQHHVSYPFRLRYSNDVARVSRPAALTGTRPDLARDVTEAVRATGLPADLDPWLVDTVLDRILVDKKRVGANLRFVAIREVRLRAGTRVPRDTWNPVGIWGDHPPRLNTTL